MTKSSPPLEIEITPEMLKAGADKVWDLEWECPAETMAYAVFEVMLAASPLLKDTKVVDRTGCDVK